MMLLRYQSLQRSHNELETRFSVIEKFVKDQYPQFFAGEVGTINDPDLKPIPIVYGAPQEAGEEFADKQRGELVPLEDSENERTE